MRNPLSRLNRGLAAVVVIALVAGGWWAGRQTIASPTVTTNRQNTTVIVAVVEATVGRSLEINATVEQKFEPVATNSLVGIVTSTSSDRLVKTGDTLYSVNAVPVRIIQGSTPFYRDLKAGMVGSDVIELRAALVALGFLDGSINGTFDAQVTNAIKLWQAKLTMPTSGIVRLGEIVTSTIMPVPVQLGSSIVLGARISGGEPAVLARSSPAAFELVLPSDQAELLRADLPVSVQYAGRTWKAVIDSQSTDPNGSSIFYLKSPAGGSVCGAGCASLPIQEKTLLPATVALVLPTTGAAVPAAAVRQESDGRNYVLLPDGRKIVVDVEASDNGLVIVSGLKVGLKVVALDAANAAGHN